MDAFALEPQTILVVDDEADIRDSLAALFATVLPDTLTVAAESGPRALEVLRDQSVDVIISDYKMPGMNGIQFLAEARRVAPEVPRVILTAFPDLDLALRAVNESSVEHFLVKPIDPPVVVDVARALLYERRARELRARAFARTLGMLRPRLR